ncbi:MAG: hypothetical protein FJY66_04415 [Calditrichaeota bacterium]|nr:hypothetical protein [Calditrichota bacterium]
MKAISFLIGSVLLVVGTAGFLLAGNSDNHTVTVQVNAINEIAITGGNKTLTISTATAGSDPDDATNSECTLAWTTNETGKKITVATNLASQNFTLKVEATGVSGGTSAGQKTITDTAADLVTAVAETTGGCTLSYTAQATAAQGTGSDVHTVTYTITAAS